VVANVLTEAGQPVADVPASSFRGTFRGKPVRVLSATQDPGPRRIVVMLDASGSMGQPPGKWQLAHGAAREIVLTSPAEYQIAFLIFADKVDRVVGFPEGRKAATDGLAALEPGRGWIPKGKTALFDAILEGLELLGSARPGDVIYVITDGEDSASRAKPDKVERALLATRVRLFALGLLDPRARGLPQGAGGPAPGVVPDRPDPLGSSRFPTRDELIRSSPLHDFAEDTGGALFTVEGYSFEGKRQAELNLSLRRLYSQMTQFYRLEVALTEPIDKPGRWKLKLVDDNGKEVKLWHPAYQSIFLPCNPRTAQKKESN